MDPERYLALYAEPLPAAQPARDEDVPLPSLKAAGDGTLPLPSLEARHFVPVVASHEEPLTLRALYTAGALCGHTGARAELGRRVEAADRDLAELAALRERRQGDPERTAVDLIEATRDLASLRASARSLEDDLVAARTRLPSPARDPSGQRG
jgi:hypothetical protein